MKTILTSIAAIVALSTAASAGGHRHHNHGHHFHFKRYVSPVYHAPAVKCHYVYKHGYTHKVCYKVHNNYWH